ncbi:hypothetical protein BOTBODRAFT_36031 [Botryobasidium botryosum FD-172 SS1]|uniref:Uncharacterized protein n=1 Tax=Botryobasidium botryosum (strain FD-172 SS1) TaxID=930990 RepID=A0A067MGK7_BOTB1|nr:hypothetical protein BOTBODRAFT_36031 [Botryobasidium botryosum FD-172 SS1]
MSWKQLRAYELAWLSELRYHEKNLLLLIRELDGLDFDYTSHFIDHAINTGALRTACDQPSAFAHRRLIQSTPKEFNNNNAVSVMCGIDYEAQFYAELRAYHDALYGFLLIKQIYRCTPEDAAVKEALLHDLNDIEPPSPEAPACPRPDDVERVFDTRVFSETPRIAARIKDFAPEYREIAKKNIEAFRRLNPYFPPFLLGFKHGDGIPHYCDVMAVHAQTQS